MTLPEREDPFAPHGRLPGQVFRQPESLGFLLTDSAVVGSRDLEVVLEVLARRYADEEVRGVVRADVEAAHERHNLQPINVPPGETEGVTEWLRHVAPGRTEPLYVDARVLAFFGQSGLWGLWCDQDRELAVLGMPKLDLGEIRDLLHARADWPWYEAPEVAEIVGPSFYPNPVPDEFIQRVREAYASARLHN